MNEISTWQGFLDISATMLGFILVVMSNIITSREGGKIKPEDARALMYATTTSFIMFTISFSLALYISVVDIVQPILKSICLVYLILGFAVSVLVVLIIVAQWVQKTIK